PTPCQVPIGDHPCVIGTPPIRRLDGSGSGSIIESMARLRTGTWPCRETHRCCRPIQHGRKGRNSSTPNVKAGRFSGVCRASSRCPRPYVMNIRNPLLILTPILIAIVVLYALSIWH
ncbi:hypothetical protein AB4144_27595, partial [Rhizobiaceae sp. 2RAB30]